MSTLVVLYNCARSASIDAYYHTYSFPNTLRPFANAQDMSMIIHTKLILAYVSSILMNDDIDELVQLSSSSAIDLIGILGEASTSANRSANGFTITELVRGMKRLLVCCRNGRLFATSTILPILVSVLGCGSTQEQLAVCELLWSLLHHKEFKSTVNGSDFPLSELLEQLMESEETTLSMLASCTLMELQESYETGK